MTKFAVFKALGCTDKKLYVIAALQTTFIYILGIIFSLPLLYLFHYLIIRQTYGFNLLENNVGELLFGILVWLGLLFILIVVLSCLTIRNRSKSDISINLRGGEGNSLLSIVNIDQVKHYNIKQLMIQFFSHPQNTIFSLLTLAFSILVILFSFTLANESAGIWNTKIDYFLTSQELIGTKVINDKTVVVTKEETFHPLEVKEIETLNGIKYIDKEPFMVDVFPLIEKERLTSSLVSWVDKYYQGNIDYNKADKVIIPNIKYILKSEEEISGLYTVINKDELQNSIIIHIPGINNDEKEQLIGKKIVLTKTYISLDTYITQNWEFNILNIIDKPYAIKLDNEATIVKDEITIVMSEDVAIDKGITKGYKDIVIYTDENLSKERANTIYNKVYSLAAGVPGSLFQYIPDVIHDYTRITDYLKLLGRLAFYISIILAIFSVYIVIFGKYQFQRRYWGIYRALGMSINRVFLYLILEALISFILATLISSIFYFTFIFLMNNRTYPAAYYIIFLGTTTISVFLMFIASAIFIKQRVKQDSIASLIRIVE